MIASVNGAGVELSPESVNIQIVMILAIGLAIASILGYMAQRFKLSPILGFLIAGYIIGPFSPGFVADVKTAEQLAEIGVILMMFGVGLHLNWRDLVSVRGIAIPGAIIQTLLSTVAGAVFTHYVGWSVESGIVIGLSIGVASTVVMIRILTDNKLVNTPQGHIAIGWLIVEDILTVVALLVLPALASSLKGENISMFDIGWAISFALFKCIALILIMLYAGFRVVSYIFFNVARTRSQELFTLTVLSVIFVIATGSALVFGTSLALGAFIAGVVIGQTDLRHQASANALPLKDTFAVIFFLSVGMLFDPSVIWKDSLLFFGIMAIILILKPLIAYIVTIMLRKTVQTAVIVAIALAQIGEFSFILSEEALKLGILPDEGYDIIVACALVSIALNPFFFRICLWFNKWYKHKQEIEGEKKLDIAPPVSKLAVIVGFGPIGQDVAKLLEERSMSTVIVDTNVDTIAKEKGNHREAVYGDATIRHILEAANIHNAELLVITTPDLATTLNIIDTARHLNSALKILARSVYSVDRLKFKDLDVVVVCDEEASRVYFTQSIQNMFG